MKDENCINSEENMYSDKNFICPKSKTCNDDDFDTCSHCGSKYNNNSSGHFDEETNLCFCDAPCEMNYDREFGLPDNYKRC